MFAEDGVFDEYSVFIEYSVFDESSVFTESGVFAIYRGFTGQCQQCVLTSSQMMMLQTRPTTTWPMRRLRARPCPGTGNGATVLGPLDTVLTTVLGHWILY